MLLAVRGRVSEHEQRLKALQRIGRGGALHLLGLVHDQDRPVALDDVDGPPGLEFVQLVVDAPRVLSARGERLDVDDHRVDLGVRRELLELVELLRVVDEVAYPPAVLLEEVLLGDLEGLRHALADRDGGHDHDELRPPVGLVEREHRLDVAVRLARAGLHLHVEIHRADAGRDEPLRHGDVLPPLDRLDVLQQLGGRDRDRRVGVARELHRARVPAGVDPVRGGVATLPGEARDDGVDGIRLVGLMLELEFHGGGRACGKEVETGRTRRSSPSCRGRAA